MGYMNLKDAIKKVESTKEIKSVKEKGYFLNSGISILSPGMFEVEQWMFTFYQPDKNLVVEAVIDDESVTVKEGAEPTHPTKVPLNVKEIKTNANKMIAKARTAFKKYRHPLSQIILSVQEEETTTWRINFITKDLFVVTVRIDARNGKILETTQASLSKTA
jgi:hypothetical protein